MAVRMTLIEQATMKIAKPTPANEEKSSSQDSFDRELGD